MPLKSIVMAVVLSGWLIASVIAFMIVAYAGFFGIGVVGLMIWFVSTRADLDQDGWVGVGVSPLGPRVCASAGAARPNASAAAASRLVRVVMISPLRRCRRIRG